nr:immunoglobulin heavy chain junction region [Mus musculus]
CAREVLRSNWYFDVW